MKLSKTKQVEHYVDDMNRTHEELAKARRLVADLEHKAANQRSILLQYVQKMELDAQKEDGE